MTAARPRRGQRRFSSAVARAVGAAPAPGAAYDTVGFGTPERHPRSAGGAKSSNLARSERSQRSARFTEPRVIGCGQQPPSLSMCKDPRASRLRRSFALLNLSSCPTADSLVASSEFPHLLALVFGQALDAFTSLSGAKPDQPPKRNFARRIFGIFQSGGKSGAVCGCPSAPHPEGCGIQDRRCISPHGIVDDILGCGATISAKH